MATIIGIKLSQRTENANKLQAVLSKYGCNIRTRIGIHDVAGDFCSPDGIILLDIIGNDDVISNITNDLKTLDNVKCELMKL